MSAWIVSEEHVNLLIKTAMSRDPGIHGGSGFSFWRTNEEGGYAGWYEIQPDAENRQSDDYKQFITPSQAGQILVSENVRSVSYRYSEPGRTYYYGAETAADMDDDEIEDLPGPTDRYYIAPYIYRDPGRVLSPGEVFKAIDCLDYQSCEHPGWRTSDAFAFCEALREKFCRRVDGYEAAPWGFERAEVPA